MATKHITMTPLEYIDYIKKLKDDIPRMAIKDAIIQSAFVLRGTIQNRIGRKGTDSFDEPLKPYSEKPMYATKEMFINSSSFRPRGKPEQGKKRSSPTKANGEQRKTMYLEHGYKELRDIQGRPTDITNLHYRLDLFKDFGVDFDETAAYIGFSNDKEIKKRKWLEEHYNTTIFMATSKEMKDFENLVLGNYLKKLSL